MKVRVIALLQEAIQDLVLDQKVTLALQVVPDQDLVLILINQRNRMHLHKVIASRAKVQITAQKQKLGLRMSLVVNGMRILTFMESEDPAVLGKSLKGLLHNVKAIAIVARNLKKGVHITHGIQIAQILNLMMLKVEDLHLVNR